MARMSMTSAGPRWDVPGWVESRFEELDGWVVSIERDLSDQDMARFYEGAPNDRCQCHHLGYVITGRFGIRKADGTEEVFEAGDAFVIEPDHTPIQFEGCEYVAFTPADEMKRQSPVVMANVTRYAEEQGIALPEQPSLA